RAATLASLHPDPWRAVDAQPTAETMAAALEVRGRTPSQVRLRRRFLRWVPVRAGDRVLEVGCGTGVVVRDLAALVGRRGAVTAVDTSATLLARARSLSRGAAGGRIAFRRADGHRLPFGDRRFDVVLAITVILHVEDPLRVVKEMTRVARPGGRVGLQDQDFGLIGAAHPDRELTARILDGVAPRVGDGQAPAPLRGTQALRVDGAAALRHVERLVAIGPRVAGSPGGEKARAYIVGELRKAGVEAEVQPFEDVTPHGRMRMANVVARLPGRRADVVALAGHYDTKLFTSFRFVGAN